MGEEAPNGATVPGLTKEEQLTLHLLNTKKAYNATLAAKICCYDKHHKRNLKCNCLHMLDREDYCKAVAEFKVMFNKLRP